jgi:hypothetical protein
LKFSTKSLNPEGAFSIIGAGVGVGVGVTVGVGVGVGVTVGVGVGVGVGLTTATPLFQTSFFPLFTHVNFLPLAVAVVPTFLHVSPTFTAALALLEINVKHMSKARNLRFNLTAFSQNELCRYRLCLAMKS